MKKIIGTTIIMLLCFSSNTFAQSIPIYDVEDSGEFVPGFGFNPNTLESLVGTPTIIVKGRFGQHIKNELFFGYGTTRQSLLSKGIQEEDLEEYGFRVSEYEIIIDEVLLGYPTADLIRYQLDEASPTDRHYTDPNIDRIFFLFENPDGTYSALGGRSILNLRNGEYTWDTLAPSIGGTDGNYLEIFPNATAEILEKMLMDGIEIENRKSFRTDPDSPNANEINTLDFFPG